MKTSDNGKKMIKQFEGCSLKVYKCPANVLTIGYGHTDGVKPYMTITQAQADKFFDEDIKAREDAINTLVKVPLTQNQFDAIMSFTFNLGVGALKQSTLLKLLNNGDYAGAAEQFKRWVYAGKYIVHGLVVRREKERQLFLS